MNNEWQPIETAPKDGTRILACNKAGEVEIVKWDEGRHSSNGYMRYSCADLRCSESQGDWQSLDLF